MSEPLTSFGELSNIPWIQGGKPSWTVVTDQGHTLYWEWRPDEQGQNAENFLFFVRTVFPNGGAFCHSQSNNAIIWLPVDNDTNGVGIRKLRHSLSWIVAVLETPEEYPGASACPDRSLSVKACRFIAEEFLRGTNPLDLFNCDVAICKENPAWWRYVEKLEKVVNWKYPEANMYRATIAEYPKDRSIERRSVRRRSRDRSRSATRVSRSRSPMKRALLRPKSVQPDSIHVDVHPQLIQSVKEDAYRRTGLRCERCNVEFEQSFELMRHYNTDMHQASLAKEFPF